MTRIFTSSLLAFFLTISLFGGTAFAAGGAQYQAEPANPTAAARLIVKEIVWKCGPGGCFAPQGNSRPGVDCSALAREVGTLRSFTVGGQPLDSAALGKCNARAR
ncbi:MAG: CC_3452 family protein [Allosphingosinicella sp.]